MRANRFFDPLYGVVTFDDWDSKLIFAPEVQRLRYVRMCNINSLLVSGASEISRFEHTVGVFRLAQEWVAATNLSRDDARIVHAAALLHDVQTGPFGHSLEYILQDNKVAGEFRHDDLSYGEGKLYLQLTNANVSFAGARFSARQHLNGLWDSVAEAIAGRGRFGSLIASKLDIDNIDNVIRLAYHVGVADRSDAAISLGLAGDFRLDDSEITISRRGVELLSHWQAIRKSLYELLLHDWAEFSAKAMLSTMMELAVERDLLGADSWVLTDDGLMSVLTKESVGEGQGIGELARRLMVGDLYNPLILLRSPNVDAYDKISKSGFKRDLERRFSDLLRTRCIFHVILDKGKTERQLQFRVREDGQVREFGRNTKEVLLGLFLSRADQSNAQRSRAIAEFRSYLECAVGPLEELQDPIRITNDVNESNQLSLL